MTSLKTIFCRIRVELCDQETTRGQILQHYQPVLTVMQQPASLQAVQTTHNQSINNQYKSILAASDYRVRRDEMRCTAEPLQFRSDSPSETLAAKVSSNGTTRPK